jgi:hypothetical protein
MPRQSKLGEEVLHYSAVSCAGCGWEPADGLSDAEACAELLVHVALGRLAEEVGE